MFRRRTRPSMLVLPGQRVRASSATSALRLIHVGIFINRILSFSLLSFFCPPNVNLGKSLSVPLQSSPRISPRETASGICSDENSLTSSFAAKCTFLGFSDVLSDQEDRVNL